MKLAFFVVDVACRVGTRELAANRAQFGGEWFSSIAFVENLLAAQLEEFASLVWVQFVAVVRGAEVFVDFGCHDRLRTYPLKPPP